MKRGHQIDKDAFIGRRDEREQFRALFRRKAAALVTCQGRRRIGKSRLITECAAEADHFLSFSGLAPREGMGREEQLGAFADQLSRQTRVPPLRLERWPAAFELLASQLPTEGSCVVLLDEISWMATGDADFAGYLKIAWDQVFSKHPRLILVLCGSVSSWIERNILNSTGFVGRCSWHFHLRPLPLDDCAAFWGRRSPQVTAAEKWRMLAVTGGIPGYLEQLLPTLGAEENIERLCFHPGGMLFHECGRIFHDIFTRRAETYHAICATLADGPRTLQEIGKALGRERGGSLGDALRELELAGFLRKDAFFDPRSGETLARRHRYRISDPYLRFHLKYVEPHEERIRKGLYQRAPLESLEAWDTIMGFQFETLVLDSLDLVIERLGLGNRAILNAGPYAQRRTQRLQPCQIDLLIRTRQALYVCEMKFRRKLSAGVIDEVREKVARLKLPASLTVRTVLIHAGERSPAIDEADYFDHCIEADEWLRA